MQIIRILNQEFLPAKNWSNRNKTSTKFKLLIHKIKGFLNLLSGNELVNMIIDVLSEEEKLILSQKYISALQGIAKTVNNRVKPKKKHYFKKPLRLATLTLSNIQELGFNCGKRLWKNCLDENERLPGGRPTLSENIQTDIENHFESITNVAANRTIQERVIGPYLPIFGRYHGVKKPKIKRLIEKNLITVRNRSTSLREAKFLFDDKHHNVYGRKLPFQTFIKYINLAKQIPILSTRNEENFVTDEYSKVISQALLNFIAVNLFFLKTACLLEYLKSI